MFKPFFKRYFSKYCSCKKYFVLGHRFNPIISLYLGTKKQKQKKEKKKITKGKKSPQKIYIYIYIYTYIYTQVSLYIHTIFLSKITVSLCCV